jgi:Flp pilus assembly protein TadG
MKLVSEFKKQAASFKKDEKGSILPLTAIVITSLMLAGGAAVDYARYSSAKAIMNTALDAAILDAGKRLGAGQPVDQKFREDFDAFFKVNIVGRGGFTDNYTITSFSADENTGKVSATAAASVDTTLMRIGGFDKMNVGTESGGIFESRDTEVAIMLDVTGSMRGSKLRALKSAANEAVSILLPDGNQTRNTRVSIVPYATSVNAGRYASSATRNNQSQQVANLGNFTNPTNNVRTNGCVTGRGGREAATDASFQDFPIGSDIRTVEARRNDLRCPNASVIPLTNDISELKSEINSIRAAGWTSGHLGIAWSYYTLSPKWNNLWNNQNNRAGEYGNDINKFAILMTDGVFNTAYNGVGNTPADSFNSNAAKAQSQNISAELCENMKADGITVYTIGFELNSASARALLGDCATEARGNEEFFYLADSEDELRDAFRSIVDNITSLRLTQ